VALRRCPKTLTPIGGVPSRFKLWVVTHSVGASGDCFGCGMVKDERRTVALRKRLPPLDEINPQWLARQALDSRDEGGGRAVGAVKNPVLNDPRAVANLEPEVAPPSVQWVVGDIPCCERDRAVLEAMRGAVVWKLRPPVNERGKRRDDDARPHDESDDGEPHAAEPASEHRTRLWFIRLHRTRGEVCCDAWGDSKKSGMANILARIKTLQTGMPQSG